MKKLLILPLPAVSTDVALLMLRLWLGLSMLLLHGLGKLQNFSGTVSTFQEKMNIPAPLGAAAILAETGCAVLLAAGLGTRWAAALLAVTMSVAFFKVHGATLAPGSPNSGELAFIYLAGFLALLLAGAGRFSVDAKLAPPETPEARKEEPQEVPSRS